MITHAASRKHYYTVLLDRPLSAVFFTFFRWLLKSPPARSSAARGRRNKMESCSFRRHKVNCPERAREGPLGDVRRKELLSHQVGRLFRKESRLTFHVSPLEKVAQPFFRKKAPGCTRTSNTQGLFAIFEGVCPPKLLPIWADFTPPQKKQV